MRLGWAMEAFRGFEAVDMDSPDPGGPTGGITAKQFWAQAGRRYDEWLTDCERDIEAVRLRFVKRAFCSKLREGQC